MAAFVQGTASAGLFTGSMTLAGLCLGVGVGGAAALGAITGVTLLGGAYLAIGPAILPPYDNDNKASPLTFIAMIVSNLFLSFAATFLMAKGLGLGLSIGTFAALNGVTLGFAVVIAGIAFLIFNACSKDS